MPSAVLDSTVLISAFLTQRGVSNELLRRAREGAFTLFLSPEILNEIQGVLLDDERRHRRRYRYPNEEAINFVDGLRAFAQLVTDLPEIAAVPRDPTDNPIVATALKAQASYVITRDDDLLSLQEYEGITMITPESFMRLLRERETRPPTDPETGETP